MALVGCSSLQATFDEWEIWRKMKFTDPPISARWTRQSNGLASTSALFSAIIYFPGWLVSSIQAGSIAVLIHCIEDLNLIWTWQIDIRGWLDNQLTRKRVRFGTSQRLYPMAISSRLVSSIPEYSRSYPLNGLFWCDGTSTLIAQSTGHHTTIKLTRRKRRYRHRMGYNRSLQLVVAWC